MADDVRAGEVVLKPIALDLCCGLGGWTRGLKAAGFEVWGFDIDERFRANYPGDRFYCSDVGRCRGLSVVTHPLPTCRSGTPANILRASWRCRL